MTTRMIEYFHASRFGNGARVAKEIQQQLAARGITVNVHHIREANPRQLPPADVYLSVPPDAWASQSAACGVSSRSWICPRAANTRS